MNMKKIIAGAALCGIGLMGVGTSTAMAAQWPISPLSIQSLDDTDGEGFGFYYVGEFQGVPTIYFAPINKGNSTEVAQDILDNDVTAKGQVGTKALSEMKDGEFKGVAFPATIMATPPKDVFDTWLDEAKDFGLDVSKVEGEKNISDKFAESLESIKKELGEDSFHDEFNGRGKEAAVIVSFDRENVKGEGTFSVLTLDEDGAMKNYKEHKVKDGKDSHKFEFSGADSFNNGESGVGERTSDEEAEVSE